VSPERIPVDAAGGQTSIGVTAQDGCAWNATATASWIAFASGSTGTGTGPLSVTVGNNAGAARTATITVAGQTVTVEQAALVAPACTYAIKPSYYNAGRGPDTVTINVTAGAGCAWTATTDATWVTVDAGRTGSGNGIVRLQLQPNSGAARTATVTIAGEAFTLHQEGPCSYSIKPTSYHAGRGPDDITLKVTTEPGCTWTASSSVSWVTVADGSSGSGSAKVRLVVQPNDGPPRSVTLSIAGQPFDLRQDGRD
jgi:hypothetical protein